MLARWVVNASPLILLSKVEYQHLLIQLAEEVVLPDGVTTEIDAGPPDDPARLYLRSEVLPIVSAPSEASGDCLGFGAWRNRGPELGS